LITGQALLITDGYAAGMPAVTHALTVFRGGQYSEEEELQGLPMACLAAVTLWDDEAWHSLSARHVQFARDAGALIALPVALEMNAVIHVYSGEFAAAEAMIEEAVALASATGSAPVTDSALLLAAWVGPSTEALDRIQVRSCATAEGSNRLTWRVRNRGPHNGFGRYEAALAAAQRRTLTTRGRGRGAAPSHRGRDPNGSAGARRSSARTPL
jgi:hypothetical protein